MRKTKKLLALLLSLVMALSMMSAVAFADDPTPTEPFTKSITVTDSAGVEHTITGAQIQAAGAVIVKESEPWSFSKDGVDKYSYGTFYSLKTILTTAGIDYSQAHGMKGVASDGFTTGYSKDNIDELYIFDMSQVTRDGSTGTAGQYGTAINGAAGNKWATDIASFEIVDDHVWFVKTGACKHYCSICNEDEPSIAIKTGDTETKVYDCQIHAAASEPVTEADPWEFYKGDATKYATGTFYSFKGILDTVGVDYSEAHGIKGTASDGFINGYSKEDIDQLYIFDMSEVTRDGSIGKKGTYGTAINKSAGNKWGIDLTTFEVVNDHVWFTKKGKCLHYCAICNEDEPVIIDKAVAPAIGKTGLTAGSHYACCGEVIKAQETVPALAKKAQPMTVKGKTIKALKAKTLKKKALTLKLSKTMTIKNAQGTKGYKITKVSKSKFKKYFKINAKTGKITIKKKLKKGTYKVTVQVTAAGNNTYNAGSKKVTLKIKVK